MLHAHTTQSNPQIQCNPFQNADDIFHKSKANNPKIYMEPQKTPNSQSNFEKKEQGWRYTTIPDFKIYYNSVTIKKQNDTGRKTDTQINVTEERAHK